MVQARGRTGDARSRSGQGGGVARSGERAGGRPSSGEFRSRGSDDYGSAVVAGAALPLGADSIESVRKANYRAAVAMAAFPGAVAFVVISVAGAIVVPLYVGLPIGVGIGAAIYFGIRKYAAESVLKSLNARIIGQKEAPGIVNLVDGLSSSFGVPKPQIWIVEDPRCDCTAIGTSESTALLVVTTGLAGRLDRIEQEALLARGLARIKGWDFIPATVASFLWSFSIKRRVNSESNGGRKLGGRGAELADFDAVKVTRYPPALISALETQVRDGGFALMAEPGATFDQRIQILHEF